MKLPHTFLIACLGAAPLCAQQVEPKNEAPKPATTEGVGANGGVKTEGQKPNAPSGHHHSLGNAQPQPEQKPAAYIGVLTREVPAELRAQFSLPEGFGLLVDEVLLDSPAKTAGLKVYDVLVKFEDQQLVNMEQFMALVRAKKKGDVVQLKVITGGKETQVSVTLGEHLVAAKEHRQHHDGFTGEMFRGGEQREHGFQNQNNALHEQFERLRHLQQELREYQERVQQWSKGGSKGPIPQAPMFNLPGHGQQPEGGGRTRGHQPQTGLSIPPGTDLQRFHFSQSQSAANLTRRDDTGEYTLKNEDGKKTFIARPKNGQEQSWPINNDQEREAVPQEFRDKLRMMDGANGGVRIEIHPRPGMNAPGNPAPAGSGNAPALPPVKAQTTSA
jgi:hypothetical protein